MSVPTSWSSLLDRLAAILGGRSGEARAEAQEWVRSAVEALYDVTSLHDLDRVRRQLAFQKSAGALLALEESGVPVTLHADGAPAWLLYREGTLVPAAGEPSRRARVAASFSRYFDGVHVPGPPWRLDDGEDAPTFAEWSEPADFPVASDG